MQKIGGNINAIIQKKQSSTNSIGEVVNTFTDFKTIKGYLDYLTGESSTDLYYAKIEETTHIFMCDYVDLPTLDADNYRLLIDGKPYEVRLIDNPMGLKYHLEFYLKFVGNK